MLESSIKYKKAFEILKVVDRNYKHYPSSEEWNRGEKMCQFLEPFYEITKWCMLILSHFKFVFYANLENSAYHLS